VVGLIVAQLCVGCSANAYYNVELKAGAAAAAPAGPERAAFRRDDRRERQDVVVCLALSGGGSRAAWFSSAVMLELEKACAEPDLMHQVDYISSVSGGSLAAAYYCISQDRPAPGSAAPAATAPSNRFWDHDTVRELMTRNYDRRCFWNFFWPTNIVRYWFTAYDRGDIMAQTFADNLFDRDIGAGNTTRYGSDLCFAELNPARPNLILNATDGTDDRIHGGADSDSAEDGAGGRFGNVFTFTREDFTEELKSDVGPYPIAQAVMASASFPGAFPYRTLRDFTTTKKGDPRYVHVFDGGNSDNLGLLSVKKVIRDHETAAPKAPPSGPTSYVVICVDAYTEPQGADPSDPDPRKPLDYLVDTDFLDSIDMLLKLNRFHIVSEFMSTAEQSEFAAKLKADVATRRTRPGREKGVPFRGEQFANIASNIQPTPARPPTDPEWEPNDLGARLVFWHITFRDLKDSDRKLWRHLNSIGTDFKISDEEADDLESAAKKLVARDPKMVARIAALLKSN
jgi:predicted acylesterase/phospholipase RssA